jgi:hypothetical protein
MLDDRTVDLIHGWLDGSLDDAGFAELQVTLAESPEARSRFWDEVRFHSDLHEAVKTHFAAPATFAPPAMPAPPEADRARPSRHSWIGGIVRRHGAFLAGGMALLAGGCGLGSVATSLSFAYGGWSAQRAENVVLVHEDFESPPAPRHDFVPRSPGYWSGDITAVVAAEQGVTPKAGEKMLRFVATAPSGESPAFNSASEIWRLVDLHQVREQLGLGDSDADLSLEFTATFNGVAPSPGRRPDCFIKAIATDADSPAARSLWLHSGLQGARESDPAGVYVLAEQKELIDADPGSWQRLTISLRAPARARTLMLYCVVSDTSDAARDSESRLEGQYIDSIQLSAQPLPAAP